MSFSARQRTKSVEKAQTLIPDARVVGYAIARAGAQPTLVVLSILGAFIAFSVVLVVATGALVMPGIIGVLLLQHLLSPPRGLAVCDRGIALTNRSLLHGRPTKVIALTSVADLQPVKQQLNRVQVRVGHELVWLVPAEDAALRHAIGASQHLGSSAYGYAG